MPNVFVTQLPHRRDPITGMYVPVMNIEPARAHGTLRYLLPPRAPFTEGSQFLPQLWARLKTYRSAQRDSLLLLGDPLIMAAVVMLACQADPTGSVYVLRWDRNTGTYSPIHLQHP